MIPPRAYPAEVHFSANGTFKISGVWCQRDGTFRDVLHSSQSMFSNEVAEYTMAEAGFFA
jgi:hypothetical protein